MLCRIEIKLLYIEEVYVINCYIKVATETASFEFNGNLTTMLISPVIFLASNLLNNFSF